VIVKDETVQAILDQAPGEETGSQQQYDAPGRKTLTSGSKSKAERYGSIKIKGSKLPPRRDCH
jgi:hypothetical protein